MLDEPITVAELLGMPNFGFVSLLDLMCVTEAGIESGFLATAPSAWPKLDPPDASDIAWDNATALLKRLFGVSMEFDGSVTLKDALQSDIAGIARHAGRHGPVGLRPHCRIVYLGPTLAMEAQRTLK